MGSSTATTPMLLASIELVPEHASLVVTGSKLPTLFNSGPKVWVQRLASCHTETAEDSTAHVPTAATSDPSLPRRIGSGSAWKSGLVPTRPALATADNAAHGLLVAGNLSSAMASWRTKLTSSGSSLPQLVDGAARSLRGECLSAVSRMATGEPNTLELGGTHVVASSTALCKEAAAANEMSAFPGWSKLTRAPTLACCSTSGSLADGNGAGKCPPVPDHQAG